MRLSFQCAALLTVYAVCCFVTWEALVFQKPRHILGEACYPASFSKDGRLLATYQRLPRRTATGTTEKATGPIQIWDLATGTLTASFLTAEHQVRYHAELSPDGRWVALMEGASPIPGNPPPRAKLHVFEVSSGKDYIAVDLPGVAWPFFRFSPDGKSFAAHTGASDPEVIIWRLDQEDPVLVLRGAGAPFGFAPDGKHLVACASEQVDGKPGKHHLRLFDLVHGEVHCRYDLRRGGPSVYLSFSPDGAYLCVNSYETKPGITTESVCAWDVETGRELCWLDDASAPRFLPDGKTLAVFRNLRCVVIDTTSWAERAAIPRNGSDAHALPSLPGLSSRLVVVTESVRHEPNPLLKWLGIKDSQFPHQTDITDIHDASTGGSVARFSHSDAPWVSPFLTPDDNTMLIFVAPGPSESARLAVWDIQSPWEFARACLPC